MSKIVTLAAAGVGYVLGAKAGRERYEQIAATARRVRADPRVRKAAADARQAAAEQAPAVGHRVSEAAGRVRTKVEGAPGSSSPK